MLAGSSKGTRPSSNGERPRSRGQPKARPARRTRRRSSGLGTATVGALRADRRAAPPVSSRCSRVAVCAARARRSRSCTRATPPSATAFSFRPAHPGSSPTLRTTRTCSRARPARRSRVQRRIPCTSRPRHPQMRPRAADPAGFREFSEGGAWSSAPAPSPRRQRGRHRDCPQPWPPSSPPPAIGLAAAADPSAAEHPGEGPGFEIAGPPTSPRTRPSSRRRWASTAPLDKIDHRAPP